MASSSLHHLVVPVGHRRTLTEVIAGQLIRLIMDGHFRSGDRFPSEFELAKHFQVGRGSIREALKALSIVGLLRIERGKGTFVAEPSGYLVGPITLGLKAGADKQSLIGARQVIEVELAGLAAERAQPEEIRAVESCIFRMRDKTAPEQVSEFLEADIAFHFAIASAAHNPILSQFLTLIRNLMHEWMLSVVFREPGVADRALSEHMEIFRAIRGRRPKGARKAMRLHLDDMGKLLLRTEEGNENGNRKELGTVYQ